MYLHQQIVDILLLQSKHGKRSILRSLYTNRITSKKGYVDQKWNRYKNIPNNINKLRYQWAFSRYPYNNTIEYLLGPRSKSQIYYNGWFLKLKYIETSDYPERRIKQYLG